VLLDKKNALVPLDEFLQGAQFRRSSGEDFNGNADCVELSWGGEDHY